MSIKKIAKLADVSIGTVDRVLHKRSGVSEETRARVLRIIKEVGYTKNTTASRLKLAANNKIKFAILLPEVKNKWNYWKLPKEGIKKAVKELRELGISADNYLFEDATSYHQQTQAIFKEKYHAIITVAFYEDQSNALLTQAKEAKIPVVFLDTKIELQAPAYFIRQDANKAGRVAARLLYGLIGDNAQYFVVNMLNDSGLHANNKQREQGFRNFFEDQDTPVEIQTINYALNDTFAVTPDMEKWFTKTGPKGIFITNSKSHLIPPIAEKYGVDDIFIVGFDLNDKNVAYLKSNHISFLINQQPKYQGYTAVKNLFNLLTAPETDPEVSIEIPVEIVVKEHF